MGRFCCKIKGVRLDHEASAKIHFESVLNLVQNHFFPDHYPLHYVHIKDMKKEGLSEYGIQVSYPHTIVRDTNECQVYTRPQNKWYRVVLQKRYVMPVDADSPICDISFSTYPFGW